MDRLVTSVAALPRRMGHRRVLLLDGLIGGVAIAGFAAAVRTVSADGRFLSETKAFDVIFTNGTSGDDFNRQFPPTT